jgi:isoleucyl-tRNA synthetase
MSEELYQLFYANYESEQSIHLKDWPKYNDKEIDEKLEEELKLAMSTVESILNLRTKEGLKIRWPLKKAFIPIELRDSMLELISFLTNIKEIKASKEKEIKLDTNVTKELEDEAVLAELSRAIQDYRKRQKYTVGEIKKISIITNNDKIISIIKENEIALKEMTDSELKIVLDNAEEEIKISCWNKEYSFSIN